MAGVGPKDISLAELHDAFVIVDEAQSLERNVLLNVIDRKWREHLYEMDYLREGIGLRAMAQRDPLVEYQREGGDMFSAMMDAFWEESIGFLFNLEVQVTPREPETPAVGVVTDAAGAPVDVAARVRAKGLEEKPDERTLTYTAPDETGHATKTVPEPAAAEPDAPKYTNVGRNAPCPCGSGKKFKLCHGRAG